MGRLACWMFIVPFLSVAGSALAVDGVIEINQASALAGGITSGDVANFPVTLSAPGSYRLTSNLSVPANTTAIQITAPNVTLDLGGFEVKGPNTCNGYPVTSCTVQAGAAGIYAATASEFLVVVHNGRVTGMAGPCIDLQGSSSSVENVVAYLCGSTGIRVAAYGQVSKSVGLQNLGDGISVGTGGAAHDNQVRGNSGSGVSAGSGVLGAIFTGNRALQNAGAGISAGTSALVTGNQVTGNVGDGISTGAGSTVSENTVSLNNDDGIVTTGSLVRHNSVSNNTGDGIEVNGGSSIIGNTVSNNIRCGVRSLGNNGWARNVLTDNNGAAGNRQAVVVGSSTLLPLATINLSSDTHFIDNLCSSGGLVSGLVPSAHCFAGGVSNCQ